MTDTETKTKPRKVFFLTDRPLKEDTLDGALAKVRELGLQNGMIRPGENVTNYCLQLMAVNLLLDRMERVYSE